MTIWFATGNLHKKAELAAILNDHGCDCTLLVPADAGLDFDPDETESTFCGNALLKARTLHALLEQRRPSLYTHGDPVIADDSGICVDALNGRPGVYSARYAGPQAAGAVETSPNAKLSSPERNALLLGELGNNPLRTARFVCAMTLLFSPDRFFTAQETCEGEMVKSIECGRGTGGFGYDPILFIPEYGKTVAELSEEEKNRISHRGKAGKIIAAVLRE